MSKEAKSGHDDAKVFAPVTNEHLETIEYKEISFWLD